MIERYGGSMANDTTIRSIVDSMNQDQKKAMFVIVQTAIANDRKKRNILERSKKSFNKYVQNEKNKNRL